MLKGDVVLYFQGRGLAYIESFSRAGASNERLGIAPFAHVVLVDPNFAWYALFDTWVTMRFLRSEWFQLQ